MKKIRKVFIANLRERMRAKGINANDLAKLSGVGKSTIYGLLDEKDRTNFTADVLSDLSKALGCHYSLMLLDNFPADSPDSLASFIDRFSELDENNQEKALTYIKDLSCAQSSVTKTNN